MPAGVLALLDDLAALLDDVAAVTQVAAKKTAGTVGKKLIVESRKVLGIEPNRPMQVLFKVFKGSLRNKAMLVPGAFAISTLAPALIPPLLGGAGVYLCYEGAEKIKHTLFRDRKHQDETRDFIETAHKDPQKSEEQKIKKAIATDLILSAEIMILSLGKVSALTASLPEQFFLLAGIGAATTGMIYGLVAGILKIEEAGLNMIERTGETRKDLALRALGTGILRTMPLVTKSFCILGTATMLGVGGNLLMHSFPLTEEFMAGLQGGIKGFLAGEAMSLAAGLASGGAALLLVAPFKHIETKTARYVDLRLERHRLETAPKPASIAPAPETKPAISLKKEMQGAASAPEAPPKPEQPVAAPQPPQQQKPPGLNP